MTITLTEWKDSLLDIGAVSFPKEIEVKGAFTSLIGSRVAFAKATIRLEPAEEFRAEITALGNDPRIQSYARSVIFGVLDVLMTTHPYAMSKVKIAVIDIDHDEVKSTPRAFRLAGREAARKVFSG